ncbi:MAG: ribonuclease H-like domain-containing protein [Armatimonadota bacterium]|nr:ribonuclease H-like domain-containing protein [Armatimonadota bacterium]
MRVAFVDLETSGLDADGWNTVLCAALAEYQSPEWRENVLVRPPWGRVRTFRRDQYRDPLWEDRSLCLAIDRAIRQYDVVVSWNGLRFDEPFLATRLREYGIEAARWPRHKDLLYTARYKLRLSSCSLDNVARHLGIEAKYGVRKTDLDRRLWRRAIRGDPRAYRYVVEHCEEDVKVLPAVWQELKSLVTEIR